MHIICEKEIDAHNIIVSPRPVWKCMTCPMHGKTASCPPFAPSWQEAREWICSFQKALAAKFAIDMDNYEKEKRSVSYWLLEKEKKYFNEGYLYAFALFPGNCNLCYKCEFEKTQKCAYTTKVRPSLDAIGIEINSLTRIDFTESVLYGLILID